MRTGCKPPITFLYMVKVKLFASYREKIGRDFIEIKLSKEVTVKELLEKISEIYNLRVENCLVAKGEEYLNLNDKVKDNDTVYLFPPVSGGFLHVFLHNSFL